MARLKGGPSDTSGSHFQSDRDREEFIFQCVKCGTKKMLARNMETSGRIPRQSAKLPLFSTHTLSSRFIHLSLSPAASRLAKPGEWVRLGRGLLQNTTGE